MLYGILSGSSRFAQLSVQICKENTVNKLQENNKKKKKKKKIDEKVIKQRKIMKKKKKKKKNEYGKCSIISNNFVCVEVLWPSEPSGVISSTVKQHCAHSFARN